MRSEKHNTAAAGAGCFGIAGNPAEARRDFIWNTLVGKVNCNYELRNKIPITAFQFVICNLDQGGIYGIQALDLETTGKF